MNYKITEGINVSQIKQLITFSNEDKVILKNTSDNVRFANVLSFKKWVRKNRKIYSFSDPDGNLAGIVWFGKELIPVKDKKYNITIAIRIYKNARGKRNALPFLIKAFEKYKKTDEFKNNSGKGFWLITNSDNLPAIKTYEKFGFEVDESYIEKGRILMVLKYKSSGKTIPEA